MDEIELIIRIMIAYARYYGDTDILEFNEKHINEIVPKLNELFIKYGYKTDMFLKDEDSSTYKNYKNLMLSIFGDTLYEDGRPYDENWFGLYDDELECLQIAHLSYPDAKKWTSLSYNYDQNFIETGSYIFSNNNEVFSLVRANRYTLTNDIDDFELEKTRRKIVIKTGEK